MRLSVGVIFGGVPNSKSVRTVQRGLDVLVATPGRLLDLIDQRALTLRELEILVLDEADQMLDLGFIHALKRIVALVPPKRQTLFFSATMPKAIKELADKYLTDPAEVAVTPVAKTADRVDQCVVHVNQNEKTALLTMFFQRTQTERTLVFSRTKHGADKIVRFLEAAGISANAIHGNKSQANRERALAQFRSGEVAVLIATDIAARGIDIPGVSHVINYDLPEVPEQYVHRIGRTARAGAEGKAVAFCAPDERGLLRDIERLTRMKIIANSLPEGFTTAVEAFKRLKPAPKRAEQPRFVHASQRTKGDRRADGQRRQTRNERGLGNPHRSSAQDHNGKRRDEQRNDGPRSSYRPEAYRERGEGQQRHTHRADGHNAHRPEGGQPRRKFRGRRRFGGPRRAQG
jgi:ATP-dependent RNA helicase RhlE